MSKLTLNDITNLDGNPASATTNINANNALIETALENTLSRDGTSPNTMSASLDMNSNKIINLAAPTNNNDAARLIDLNSLSIVTGTPIPTQTGNSGKYLTTDGSVMSWATISSLLASMTGNAGKILTTDGTNNSWATAASILAGVALSVASLTVTGSSVPANGMYLSNASEISFATNSIQRAILTSATFTVLANGSSAVYKALSTGTADLTVFAGSRTGGTTSDWQMYMPSGSTDIRFYTTGGFAAGDRFTLTQGGSATLKGQGSGAASFTVDANGGGEAVINVTGSGAGGNAKLNLGASGGGSCIVNGTNAILNLQVGGTTFASFNSTDTAVTISGNSGTHSTKIADSAGNSYNAGYLGTPINTQNTNYTCVLADAGKTIYHTDSSAYTYTIPANASVAYDIGTQIAFTNDAGAAVNITIAITTDTLVFAGAGTTGSRTLARYGSAVATKVASTKWYITGTGLT